MEHRERLLARLDAIGLALEATGRGLALIGLGSVGQELGRLDAYSDLDFFAVVEDGAKAALLADIGWLTAVAPVDYAFRNTPDGYKLLYADGIFCEFAVFTMGELAGAAYAPGRIVWRRPDVDPAIAAPVTPPASPAAADPAWQLGEALTNLYVGLGRMRRGELLTAQRFVQHYAVDRVVQLAAGLEAPRDAYPDPFGPERRVEARLPGLAAHLPAFVQGYGRSAESALAILAYLERHFAVSPAMARAIRQLAE